MKINLVVAQGVHTGKIIPVGSSQFLIGRDPHCNLRPASAAISKQHCGVFVRGTKVFIKDYGSTNGTAINGVQVVDEHEISNGDKLKVGPLEFVMSIETTLELSTIKATAKAAVAVATVAAAVGAPVSVNTSLDSGENAAAMLMAMDDSSADPTAEAKVPDGTTVMDIPAIPGADPKTGKPAAPPKPAESSSKTAADILSKYMRRPRS